MNLLTFALTYYHAIGGNSRHGLSPDDTCLNYTKIDTPFKVVHVTTLTDLASLKIRTVYLLSDNHIYFWDDQKFQVYGPLAQYQVQFVQHNVFSTLNGDLYCLIVKDESIKLHKIDFNQKIQQIASLPLLNSFFVQSDDSLFVFGQCEEFNCPAQVTTQPIQVQLPQQIQKIQFLDSFFNNVIIKSQSGKLFGVGLPDGLCIYSTKIVNQFTPLYDFGNGISVFKAKTSSVEALLLTTDNQFYKCDQTKVKKMPQPPQKIHDFAFFEDKIIFDSIKGVWGLFKWGANCLESGEEMRQLSFETEPSQIFADFIEKGFVLWGATVKEELSITAIVGIVVGVLLAVAVIVGSIWGIKKHRAQSRELLIQFDGDEEFTK